VFDAGRQQGRRAAPGGMRKYDEQVADYRNAVLTAYQEVEDNLAALHRARAGKHQRVCRRDSHRQGPSAGPIPLQGGAGVTYLEVATTETTALQAQLSRVSILNRRMDASVLLVKALGGGVATRGPLGRIDASAEAYAGRTN